MSQVISFNQSADGTVGSVNMGFRANLTALRQNVTGSNIRYQIIYDAVEFDTTNGFDLVTSKFTAPVRGIYHFDTSVDLRDWSANDRSAWELKISNITQVKELARRVSTNGIDLLFPNVLILTPNVSGLLQLEQSDVVEVSVAVSGSATSSIDVGGLPEDNYFSGFLVQAL